MVLLLIGKSLIISLFNLPRAVSFEDCPEFSEETYFSVHHQRDWTDFKNVSDYCISYQMKSQVLDQANGYKNKISDPKAKSYPEFWGKVYKALSQADEDHIKVLIDSLDQISKDQALDYMEFAHAVVKMVQDIPYQYIISSNCTSEYADYPCFGNQRYGITSPVEFLYTLRGDCDSRTVLLYTILRQFNYDPVVLISKEYRHSMLALNIPAAGEYLKIDGKKYYFWETTSTGWEPGIIPPGMDNKAYWNIALKHEL